MHRRKRSGIQQQEPQNSPASWRRIPRVANPGNTAGCDGRNATANAPAQARRQADRGQGLKILQREATYITALHQELPCSQAKWLWDCLTPYTALAGRSVSASACAFSRGFFTQRVSFGPTFHGVAANFPVARPQQSGLRGQASEPG